MPGRPRKPVRLHLVQNTTRPCRHDPHAGPNPSLLDAVPEPPEHITGLARECWLRFAPQLVALGLLTDLDTGAFEMLCAAYREWRDADLRVEILGDTVYETRSIKDGLMRRPHPEVAQRSDAERRFMAALSHFGMTPSARAKMAVPGAAKHDDPLNRFFG